MLELQNCVVMNLLIGAILTFFGVKSLLERRASWMGYRYNRWSSGPRQVPITYFTVHGARAFVTGIICVIAAAITIGPWIIAFATSRTALPGEDVLLVTSIVGIAIALIGFIAETFFEILHRLRQSAAQKEQLVKQNVSELTETKK